MALAPLPDPQPRNLALDSQAKPAKLLVGVFIGIWIERDIWYATLMSDC